MDRDTHAQFLDYRDRHSYFSKGAPLDAAAFETARRELDLLERQGDSRDDEEQARHTTLLALLLLD